MEEPNLQITTVNSLSNTKVLDNDSLKISVYKLHLENSLKNAIFLTDELIPPIIEIELENSTKSQNLIRNWSNKKKDHSIIQRLEHPHQGKITWILRIHS